VDEKDFEGTLVLEQLAQIGKVDDFFEASLMRRAKVDAETIAIVLKKMADADGEH
jgi:hypothetical protein